MVVFVENDASQFAQTNGSQKRNKMLPFAAAATADAEEHPRDYTCIHDCCSDDYGACEITY
jgi:hypothetical protein